MELGVLGPLQVRQHGLPVAVPGAKPRAVLTMLGLHGGSVVSAETLTELLWGARPPRTADKALQTHISSLRRALGDGFVLTEGSGWTLNTTEIDATRYKLAARSGRDAIAAGDAAQAVVRFDEALSLWRGIPELPDGHRAASEKTRWIEGHAALVEDRADALLATGRAAEIVGELEAAIADAPLRERRWGQLMLALYRAGRQGEALAAYQRARSLLVDELGVDPGPNLRRLEAAIVAQDAALEIPVSQQLSTVTKAVTFLLTDIEGSTAAWEAQADAMAVALARHDEIVEQVVTSRGGRLVKTRGEGDATFSVFDRPSSAAAAAIELQEAIRHEPWSLANSMRIRISLHTGEVELRDGDYFGRAVNRAARLRSLAAGGQILCSGATAELVIDTLADDVVLADLGMRQLKNLARPEHVFELRLDAAEDPDTAEPESPMQRPTLPAVLTGPGPFVGRGEELAGLLTAWQSTLTGGTRAVLVAGEPGVGKTRLAGEWSRQVYEEGAVVLYGRCDEDLGAAYQPFAEALRSLVPCLGAERLRGLRGVEALLPLVPGLTDVVPDLPTSPRSDPDSERYALFDAVVALLCAASTRAPVVLILDDLHWAAKPTLLLLRHLLRFGEQARVQIVGTYRSTDLDRSHPLAAMLTDLHRDGTASRLALTGLDEKDVSAYVSEAGYNDEELARALASVTGGNPFFLIEALRHVDESGGRWDPNTLPQGVREAVSRRLSRLPEGTNKALAAAAVVGSRFAVELVERVVDDDLVDAFDEARKAGIVIEEPGGRYRFNHALVRQSLLVELPSVRRMRLHQRIALTLEAETGAEDELLAELAYHYFECAWAGNAAKAVEYCRRAADQAMARLAYEGAADLYDRALHALEELDDELPDRGALQTELLVARCEALLAAGDVGSAAGAVAQLQQAAGDSVRLAAWGTCFDGELLMLTNPEQLDEIEAAVGAAAEKLAGLEDAAGEAKAHTVRAACLARLGRIGDAETALDQALTAARRAHDHRRVNAVLAGAPLAALWGPNPVPRAGGRCLDVVRLLRITTGSPVVEATSTRCQGVLDALRGRAAAGRALIDSARRSLTELGMRHALLEVEQFAGIVELIANEPAAAEPLLRRACDGFRRMGLDADTAETAAFLARACLALDRDAEAAELCTESERLAGHALKPSITWRTVRAQLLARGGAHDEARRMAEEAVRIAERTDALVDHGDACLTLAVVLNIAGDVAGARAAAEQAIALFERKGAAALAELARSIFGSETPEARSSPEAPVIELENACVRTLRRVEDAANREAWNEVEEAHARIGSIESRRKIVGFERIELPADKMASGAKRFIRDMRAERSDRPILAIRGERLALARTVVGPADDSPGAPSDEMLQLVSVDGEGRIAMQIWFDIEDMDAAIAELDALHASSEPDTACVRLIRRLDAAYDRDAWEEISQCIASVVSVESRRKIVGVGRVDNSQSEWLDAAKHYRQTIAQMRYRHTVLATRGERLALTSLEVGLDDQSPGAPRDALLQLYGLDKEGQLALHIHFDIDDMDAAIAELDVQHARLEGDLASESAKDNACVLTLREMGAAIDRNSWDAVGQYFAPITSVESRRKIVGFGRIELQARKWPREVRRYLEDMKPQDHSIVATRGECLALVKLSMRAEDLSPGSPQDNVLWFVSVDEAGLIDSQMWFDVEDLDAAVAELDARYLAGEAAPYARVWRSAMETLDEANRHEPGRILSRLTYTNHQRVSFGSADFGRAVQELWELVPDAGYRATSVHALDAHGTVAGLVIEGADSTGNELQWYRIVLLLPEESRMEVFDDDDLASALARFEELRRPVQRLDNAASRVLEGYLSCFPTRDWDLMSRTLADSFEGVDRRQGVTRSPTRHRIEEIANLQVIAELGCSNITSTPIAIRGERLVLAHHLLSAPGEYFEGELIDVVEIDGDNKIVNAISYDTDHLDIAMAELDSRYLAGEAAPHAHTWSVVAGVFDALNRHETPAATPDWVNIDHRRGTPLADADLKAIVTSLNELTPDLTNYVEAVHRLHDHGALVTQLSRGTSPEGFDAEWRIVNLLMADGDMVSRCELFDESDLDAALARFDELSRPAVPLENMASIVAKQFWRYFACDDRNSMKEMLLDDVSIDDRRPVVNSGLRKGKSAVIDDMQLAADFGDREISPTVLATRGSRLALCRTRHEGRDHAPDAFAIEVIHIIETCADNRMSSLVVFNAGDLDSAFAELETRYLAGEAAEYARTWSLVSETFAAYNNREQPAVSADWVNIDHRRAAAFPAGEMIAFMGASWADTPDVKIHIEAVHQLSAVGAVVTWAGRGRSPEGFEAEWRAAVLVTVGEDLINRCEMFDTVDLDAALAKLDELSSPTTRARNMASRVYERFNSFYTSGDRDALAETMAEGFVADDRRRLVGMGNHPIGPNAAIEHMRITGDLGVKSAASTVIAIRGQSLALMRARFWGRDELPDAFNIEVLHLVEIDGQQHIVTFIAFDLDDLESAIAELDSRYIGGEAAAFADTWSVIARAYAAVMRHELPPWTTDAVRVDHRRAAAFAPGDVSPYLHAMWDQTPDEWFYIESVHRLTSAGAVVTHVANGTSQQGFEGEWREVTLSMIEGDRINRSELFDESDLDAALARLDQLSRPAPVLMNAASQVNQRFDVCFAKRDWAGMAALVAEDMCNDDRRRVVGSGIRTGRDAEIAQIQAIVDLGARNATSVVVAIRGQRLALLRTRFSGPDLSSQAFHTDIIDIVEIDPDHLITRRIAFDSDDFDAAFAELDARYLVGEAGPVTNTWSIISAAHTAFNRRERWGFTSDCVSIDHRRSIAFAPGELAAYVEATWDVAPNTTIYVESVHRLNESGALVTQAARGTSDLGFDAEWRELSLSMVDGELINHTELFDEDDLDLAIARFDELNAPLRLLQNAASQMITRFQKVFGARDWDGMAEIFAEDICLDDRRRVVGARFDGREATIANMRASADTGVKNVTSAVLAIRGDRLSLQRVVISGKDNQPGAFRTEALHITEIDATNRATAFVMFDLDETDAAFAELDARYLAGEAASHSGTWSAITEGYAAFNRRDMPKTTPDWLNIDHRTGGSAFAPGDQTPYIHATWEIAPQVRSHATAVHRLNDLGAVVTQLTSGTSDQGFDVEWQDIILFTIEGNLLSRCEVFDEGDFEAALTKFDDLSRQAPRRPNLASQMGARFRAAYAARDWDAMARMLAEDFYNEDRRSVVNGGIRHGRESIIDDMRSAADLGIPAFDTVEIASRGEYLVLCRADSHYEVRPGAFYVENLVVAEIDADERMTAQIMFDIDDIDAAYQELESRYLNGEGAAHSQTWSVIVDTYAALNRHELTPTPPDWVYVDHHRLALWQGDFTSNMLAAWEVMPDWRIQIAAVHRLTHLGAVITAVASGSSREGFDAEEPGIALVTVRDGAINRFEYFDVADLDAALARFDELNQQAARPENAASRSQSRLNAAFAARDWDAMAALLTDDTSSDDRRPIVGGGLRCGRDAVIEDWRAIADVGVKSITSTVIATRGEHLALGRYGFVGHDQRPEAYHTEVLGIVEFDGDQRMTACVMLDAGQIDAAFDELEARYVAGEAAAHANTWTLVTNAFAAMNRRELPATRPDWVTIDHRRLSMIEPTSRDQYLSAAIDVTQLGVYVEAVQRLSDAGAVVSWQGQWTTPDGFDAEWRGISVLTFDGDLVARCEVFDEADLDAALKRFDELNPDVRRLDNAASRAYKRYNAYFVAREWAAMAELVADDIITDDRRRVISGGLRHGRAAQAADMRAVAGVGVRSMESSVIAIRGDRLALMRARVAGNERPDAFGIELLIVVGINGDGRLDGGVLFDLEDIDAAFEELDRRYLTALPADCANAWAIVVQAYAGMTRGEFPPTAPDLVNIDHRRAIQMAPDSGLAYLRASWEVAPEFHLHIEAVHRLTNFGAVFTRRSSGTSHKGFDAEWRAVDLITVEGGLINRGEIFDEEDLDAAVARFDEVEHASSPLENAATRASAALAAAFNRRDVDGLVAIYGANAQYEDHRKGLSNVGLLSRDFGSGLFELEAASSWRMDTAPVGIRGQHLALVRHTYRDTAESDQPVTVEALLLTETDGSGSICHCALFDLDDNDAAFKELDARYGAGEAAAHAHTWSVIANTYAELNRYELYPTTPGLVSIDRRGGASFAPGDLIAYVRAAWEQMPDLKFRIDAVHQLDDRGAVFTQVLKGTTQEGFAAEWRLAEIMMVEGDRISRAEIFDDADIDAALARFDELNMAPRQLGNVATRGNTRVVAAFNRRDMDGLAAAWAPNSRYDDRRRGLRDEGRMDREYARELMRDTPLAWRMETEVVGIRGRHLALVRQTWRDTSDPDLPVAVELLAVLEAADDELLCHGVFFDPDDIGAAFAELEARYLAGESAAHKQTWSRVVRTYVGFNQREIAATTPDWVNISHHRGTNVAQGDMISWIRSAWEVIPDGKLYVHAVHRLTALGAVFSVIGFGTSEQGFKAEWRDVHLMTFDGEMINDFEIFEETDIDAAVTRFDQLRATTLLENAATRANALAVDAYNRRDVDGFLAAWAANGRYDDRRKGLRDEGQMNLNYVREMMRDVPAGMRMESDALGIRGHHLVLVRQTWRDTSEKDLPVAIELLAVLTATADELNSHGVFFDADDIGAAFAELDARWIASGECVYPKVVEAVRILSEFANRHEWDALAARHSGATYINHRQLRSGAETVADDMPSLRTLTTLVPDLRFEATEVLRHSAKGVVIHTVAKGISTEDVAIELPFVVLLLIDGDRFTHAETFDLDQRDEALARFDEIGVVAPPPENAVARVLARVVNAFDRRDPDSYLALFAEDCMYEDRRKGLRDAGSIRPDYAQTVTFGAAAGWQAEFETIAVRGEHLMMGRSTFRDLSEAGGPVAVEALNVGSVTSDELISWFAVFDPEDVDAAYRELTARWIASGEVAHPEVIEAAQELFDITNRHDWGALAAIEADAVFVNHRQLGTGDEIGDHLSSLRTTSSLIPDMRVDVIDIPRHSAIGVVTNLVVRGTTLEGAAIELPAVIVLLFDKMRVTRMEAFDLNQRDLALARFDELNLPT